MRKFLALAILSMSSIAFVSSAEAKTNSANAASDPQIRVQIGPNRRNNRHVNRRVNRRAVRTYTRNVRVGRQLYRETYRVVYRPNGMTRTRLISRVRIGRY